MGDNRFSVFTKPWKTQSLDALGELVRDMGFDAVEYPFRDGYQVPPSEGRKGIVNLAKGLEKHGVKVTSLASGIDVRFSGGKGEMAGVTEEVFQGCGEAGIPVIRVCQGYNRELGFHENMDDLRRRYDVVLPFCQKYGVTLGVQMHYGQAELACSWDSYILLKDYDPKYIGAVWDAGHSGLAGEGPRYALDCLWNNLCMVNFKAAYWKRENPAALADEARWGASWVTGRHGMGSWKAAVDYLKERGYKGTVCLPAEYSDEPNVEKYTREDVKYIKELFGGKA
ncbi:MAG: sugar phosphate isomerase/epimerase [Treponema sp.]|jgi:sugar phosphate isomerase/epimerase|nr:sugar phosphate isomerase/epimerase [Treponema sp.]